MSTKFKLIKTNNWQSASGTKGTTLTLALKGHIFNVNKDDFDSIDVKEDVVTINETFKCIKEPYVDTKGVTKIGLRLKPTLEFDIQDC